MRFIATAQGQDFIFASGTGVASNDFRMALGSIDLSKIYSASVKESDLLTYKQSQMDDSEYQYLFKKLLLSNSNATDKESNYSLNFDQQDNQILISLVERDESDLLYTHASFPVPSTSDKQFFWDFIISNYNMLQSEIKNQEVQLTKLIGLQEISNSMILDSAQLRQSIEEDLLGKFALLLNSKKQKIKSLQSIGRSKDKQQQQQDEQEEEIVIKPRKKGKK